MRHDRVQLVRDTPGVREIRDDEAGHACKKGDRFSEISTDCRTLLRWPLEPRFVTVTLAVAARDRARNAEHERWKCVLGLDSAPFRGPTRMRRRVNRAGCSPPKGTPRA